MGKCQQRKIIICCLPEIQPSINFWVKLVYWCPMVAWYLHEKCKNSVKSSFLYMAESQSALLLAKIKHLLVWLRVIIKDTCTYMCTVHTQKDRGRETDREQSDFLYGVHTLAFHKGLLLKRQWSVRPHTFFGFQLYLYIGINI